MILNDWGQVEAVRVYQRLDSGLYTAPQDLDAVDLWEADIEEHHVGATRVAHGLRPVAKKEVENRLAVPEMPDLVGEARRLKDVPDEDRVSFVILDYEYYRCFGHRVASGRQGPRRERDEESRTHPLLALNPNLPALALEDPLGDREPEPLPAAGVGV